MFKEYRKIKEKEYVKDFYGRIFKYDEKNELMKMRVEYIHPDEEKQLIGRMTSVINKHFTPKKVHKFMDFETLAKMYNKIIEIQQYLMTTRELISMNKEK